MRVLFTASNLIGSNVIRWGLEEPVSHVAIEQDGVVLHATWGGVDIDHLETFTKRREIIYEIEIPELGLDDLLDMARKYEGRSYDFTGLILFCASALSRRLFNTPLPRYNKWNKSGSFLCTEVATTLILGKEDGIITPYELYLKLKEIQNAL